MSVIFNSIEDEAVFLPTYKGIDVISNSWSLINYFNNNFQTSELFVKNEVIEYKQKKYVINGKHIKVENTNYVWSDLSYKELT